MRGRGHPSLAATSNSAVLPISGLSGVTAGVTLARTDVAIDEDHQTGTRETRAMEVHQDSEGGTGAAVLQMQPQELK